MTALAPLPLLLQAAVMLVDEFHCHRRRGLPAWERWGHPLDTLTVIACAAWLLAVEPSTASIRAYLALSAFSCLFVTKDEKVHQETCSAFEHWLHSLLFVLHPISLLALGLLWSEHDGRGIIRMQLAALTAFGIYQTLYWNLLWKPHGSTMTSTMS